MSPPGYPSAWLHPCRARFRFTWRSHSNRLVKSACNSPFRPLAGAAVAAPASLFEFAVALRVDFIPAAGEHVCGRDIADGAVQAHVVVVIDVVADQAPRIVQRQRRAGPDAFLFERFVPAFDFAVGLRIIRRGAHVRHARDADELLEVPGDELRSVVGDDARPRLRVLLRARCKMISMSASFIDSRRSQCTMGGCSRPARCTDSRTCRRC